MKKEVWIVVVVVSILSFVSMHFVLGEAPPALEIQNMFTLYAPLDAIYETRIIPLNITFGRTIAKLNYIVDDGNERTLCNDCAEYGHAKKRTISLTDGFHRLILRALAYDGASEEKEISFIVDTKAPTITGLQPKRGFVRTILMSFVEKNPASVALYYGTPTDIRAHSINLSTCIIKDDKYHCEINVHLTDFDGKKIIYWFTVNDIKGKMASSKTQSAFVDVSAPIITDFQFAINGTRGYFKISVNESNFDAITYTDDSEPGRTFNLCVNLKNGVCEKTKNFKRGSHTLNIFVADQSSNVATRNVSFTVV
ncbi:MAG: hypothetical protein AABX16_00775 [Nanoarchaeota archaeon]